MDDLKQKEFWQGSWAWMIRGMTGLVSRFEELERSGFPPDPSMLKELELKVQELQGVIRKVREKHNV